MDSIDVDEVESGPEYAGFWIRVGAALLDGICLSPLTLFDQFYNKTDLKSLELAILIPFIVYAYKVIMEYKFGATLGKMIVKIKVVNAEGERLSFSQALGRTLPWLITTGIGIYSTVLLFQHELFEKAHSFETVAKVQEKVERPEFQYVIFGLLILIAVTIGIDSKHQGFHDKTVGAFVVKKRA